jgi:membrane-bound metal-dependent hydrolase YbcI (DUF457 family)
MAQAGIHSILGLAMKKWAPGRAWLPLGIVIGSLLPDADNLAVAMATIAKLPTEGLHRTFTHSLFTAAAVAAVFFLVAKIARQPRWNNLGIGLGIGVLLHILLDLLIWFNGVEILWPIPSWINLWSGVTPPAWFNGLMMTAEFLCFALFFLGLTSLARHMRTNRDYLGRMYIWIWIELALFVVFTILVYVMQQGFMTIYGLIYLLSLGLAIGVSIRMRKTIEAIAR